VKLAERQLVSGVLRGDRQAMRLFNHHYRPKLLRFVLTKVGRFEDAEEITQDILVSALYSLPSFSGKSSFNTWFYSIARHEVVDFYRKKKLKEILFSHFPILERLASKALSPEMTLEEKELEEKAWRCLAKLNEGYREILRLKYVRGLSLMEIARRIEGQKTVKAVEARLRRARHRFARVWNDQKTFFTLNPRNLSFFEECLGALGPSLPDTKKTAA